MNRDPKEIFQWWAGLQPSQADNRATLAKLRHAGTVSQLCLLPETMAFCRKLDAKRGDLENLALLAGVLAMVREHRSETFAAQLGTPREQPKLSPLRFQRLIEAQTRDDQLVAFRRAVLQNGRAGNIHDLASSLLDWDDARRQRWVYDYYQSKNPKSA
jgi:CRISPR system Cascade subunit CasB